MENIKIGDRVIVEFELEVNSIEQGSVGISISGRVHDKDGKYAGFGAAPLANVKEIVK